jgi:hypothetical protein
MIETLTNRETQEAERRELEILLASELFRRAPILARILEYLCERQIQGDTYIKEYEIATRVMGRPSDFDPQIDGSVRVNLHHLRKKLKQYYDTEGARHPVRRALPIGQSLPSFVPQEGLPSPPVENQLEPLAPARQQEPPFTTSEAPETTLAAIPERFSFSLPLFFAMMTLVIAAAAATWLVARRYNSRQDGPVMSDAVLRIACGRNRSLHDDAGRLWSADAYSSGGHAFDRPVTLTTNGGPAELYNHGREGIFSYAIPLPRSSYEVHLYFAESAVRGEGFRTMNIFINGKRVQQLFDVTSDAGGFATPTEKIYAGVKPAADGKLHISFTGITGAAFVNGIEIMAGDGFRMRTLRQTTLAVYSIDPTGTLWLPDTWYRGGRVSYLPYIFRDLSLEGFYRNERFGNFTYSLPVVDGHTYGVTLYFQEAWFSQSAKNRGRRRFNVSCNGIELLNNFDILSKAYPSTQRATMHFGGIEPSGQGKLVFSFSPIENYAEVNAIMVEDETQDTSGSSVSNPSVSNVASPAPTE